MGAPRVVSMVGQVFGAFVVIRDYGAEARHRIRVRCSCGAERDTLAQRFRKAQRPVRCHSCYATRDHGHRRGGPSPEYATWNSVQQRCANPNAASYQHYGGRWCVHGVQLPATSECRSRVSPFLQFSHFCFEGLALHGIAFEGQLQASREYLGVSKPPFDADCPPGSITPRLHFANELSQSILDEPRFDPYPSKGKVT